ncbi:MAG TPA: IPT/TIG domain-containing protein [Luteitalea sp.]|nr:IPT/TIG domain-containing protein [Luteitalea sp.]
MFRAVRLATVGVCAAVSFLCADQAFAQSDLKTWYFAEGSTAPVLPFEQEILIGNPTAETAVVKLRFFPQDGGAPIEGGLEVKPYSRQGVNARQFMPNNFGFSLEVTSTASVVVERSMYWGGGLFNYGAPYNTGAPIDMRAGHNAVGVNALQTSWSFAEGSAGFFDTYVLVSNPGATPATVQVAYLTSTGEHAVVSEVIPAGQRRTYFANDALRAQLGARAQYDFAIEVTSDVGVVAERAMYWNGFQGGHATVGVTPQPAWLFAEGAQFDNALSTYVLLFNPNATAITVDTNFYGDSGVLQTVSQTIAPRSRAQIFAGEYDTLRGKSFSITSASTGALFVAERAVYKVNGPTLGEGTVTAGIPKAAYKWGFADGQEGGFVQYQNPADPDRRLFTSYYLVLNNTDTPATVRGVFYIEQGDVAGGAVGVEHTLVVNPRSRGTFAPQLLPGLGNQKFAAFFESTVPVAMERAVYWGNGIKGAHASTGTPLPDALPALLAPTAPAAPTLAGISPSKGSPSGGTVVTLTGTGIGLGNNTTVAFGSTAVPAANITVNNANSISVVAPASGRGVAGIIVNTRGVELFNPAVTFEYVDPFVAMGAPVAIGDNYGLVASVGNARRFDLIFSCTEHGAPNSNNFMFEVVAELRRRYQTNRWGLNWKRGNVGDLSQDIVNYYNGPEGSQMRNSTQVRIYDIIGGHCGNNPGPFWVDQTGATRAAGTVGRWTTDPMCRQARYRDAKFNNGDWMFPECR